MKTMDLETLCKREQAEIDELKKKLFQALDKKTDYLLPDEESIWLTLKPIYTT